MKKFILLFTISLSLHAQEYSEIIEDYLELAHNFMQKNDHEKAQNCYQEIERLEHQNHTQPTLDSNMLVQKAHHYYKKNDFWGTLYYLKKALIGDPENSKIQLNIAHLEKELQNYHRAISAYKKAANIDPALLDIYSGLGYCYSILGDLPTAWKYWRIWQAMEDKKTDKTKPLWKGENLKGKSIVIEDEGGYGDLFQWIRYASLFKQQGAYVILEARPEIFQIISSCKDIDMVVKQGQPLPDYDFYIPLGRIHATFNTSLTTIPCPIPYLFADQHLIAAWRPGFEQDSSFKIGICWSAQNYINNDTGQPIINNRSIPLNIITQLSSLKDVSLYSLQYGLADKELSSLENNTIRSSGQLDIHGRFMDTAAIIHHLDLVITIDTSIAHLAGALGKKVWVLLPHKADWRWLLNRNDSPWYPTMRLFRQPKQNDWQSVIDQVLKALDHEICKKNKLEPHVTLTSNQVQELFTKGIHAVNNGDLTQGLECFSRLLSSYPDEIGILYNTAYIMRRLNMLEQCIHLYKKVLELNPNHHDASFGLGQAYLASGIIKEGWELFNARRADLKKQIPSLEFLHDKKIIITAEWGLGDMFFMIRYAQLLKKLNNHITVQVPRELEHIIKLCPYIDAVVTINQVLPQADVAIPLFFLPTLFKTTQETIPHAIPYLYADKPLINEWHEKIEHDQSFKIGLCWDIGHHDTKFINWQRSIQLAELLPFGQIAGVSLYNLQKNGSGTINQLKDSIAIHDFGPDFDHKHGGFMDTAALIQNLDLVITVDTAVAHLAAGLGKETWVMLPFSPDYRWTLHGQTTPWYPTMRLFRQKKPGNWYLVVKEIVQELKKRIALK